MDLQYNHVPHFTPAYVARLAEEEAKLRWLIARHPEHRELAYYLLFLLAANGWYAIALMECRRVLECYPGNVVDEMWRKLMRIGWHRLPPWSASGRTRRRRRRWPCVRRHSK